MKKNILKILTIVILIVLAMVILPIESNAAGSFNASASPTNVNVGDTIKITVTATGAAGMYQVSANNSNVTLVSGSENEFIENQSVTVQYKATKAGNVTITASALDLTDLDNSKVKVKGSQSFNITIKEKTNTSTGTGENNSGSSSNGNTGNTGNSNSSGNTSSSGDTPTQNTFKPTFTNTNKTVYTTGTCNLRDSWSTSSKAVEVSKDTELKLTGTSSQKDAQGYIWYRVEYKGATKYIANSLITYEKPKEEKKDDEKNNEKNNEKDQDNKNEEENKKSDNKNLSSLKIEGIELEPKFDKETTQYTIKVDGDVTELKIDAKAEDSKAKVNVEGNKDLKEGDNVIKVKVTAEDETTRTYFITATVGEGMETNKNLTLSELKIDRVNFEETFKPDVYRYELTLNTFVENLDITAVASQADAKIEITGNSNFKEGTNTVTILLTSQDGMQTATYQIEVKLPEKAMINNNKLNDKVVYIIAGVGGAIIILVIIIMIVSHRRNSAYDEYEEDDNEDETNNTENDVEEEKYAVSASKSKKSNVTLDDFLSNDDDEKPRKSKGRHSM